MSDRNEAMVADVDGRVVSVVWADGSEEDGMRLDQIGPCPDPREHLEHLDDGDDTIPRRPETSPNADARAMASRAVRAASAAKGRGNARFKDGDVAAAAAEYVESCAWLVAALRSPGGGGARVLPGSPSDWHVPDATAVGVHGGGGCDGRDPPGADEGASANPEAPARDASHASALVPSVGMRVRVMGADGTSRAGMVSYVEEGEQMCDVMFDDDDEGGDDDEEVGVSFDRLFGAGDRGTSLREDREDMCHGEEEEERRRRRAEDDAAAGATNAALDELAGCLHNVARCHLRLHGQGGGASAALACVDAASAALSLRRSAVAFYLRGRAHTALNRFRHAGEDLKMALALVKPPSSALQSNNATDHVNAADGASTSEKGERREEQKEGRAGIGDRELTSEEEFYGLVNEMVDAEGTNEKGADKGCHSEIDEVGDSVVLVSSKDAEDESSGRIAVASVAAAGIQTVAEREIRAAMRVLKQSAKARAEADRRLAHAIMVRSPQVFRPPRA